MAYLLDSNVSIEAKRLHYGFDFCPAFWDWLDQQAQKGTVRSVSRVATELFEGGDDLADWAKARDRLLFIQPTQAIINAYAKIAHWTLNEGYEQVGAATFLAVADSYLVATALAEGHTVVTRERPSDSKRKIKIPNACVGLNVPYMDVFEMLRREKARFVLGKAA